MAFWNNKPKSQLPDWDMAKKITKAEVWAAAQRSPDRAGAKLPDK